MVWLTLAWKFLRSVPREIWLLLAFMAAIAFAVGYHQNAKREAFEAGDKAGAARVQKGWDDAVARGKEEIARLDRENAAAEAKATAEAIAIGENRRRDLQDAIAQRDHTIAGLRAGTIKLQDRWASCVSQAEAGGAAAVPGGSVPADELRREVAEEISEGFDSDSRISRLIEFVQVQQEFMRKVCPVQ